MQFFDHRMCVAAAFCLSLVGCGGGSSGSSDAGGDGYVARTWVELDVASQAHGAVAVASYNADTAGNLIDDNDDTTWISDPYSPIVVDLGAIEELVRFELRFVTNMGATKLGSNPDLILELSADGSNYLASEVTFFGKGQDKAQCTSFATAREYIRCNIPARIRNPVTNEFVENPYWKVRFIRITTTNGNSFEFTELDVIAKRLQ